MWKVQKSNALDDLAKIQELEEMIDELDKVAVLPVWVWNSTVIGDARIRVARAKKELSKIQKKLSEDEL